MRVQNRGIHQVDIPHLSFNGIQFESCFTYTYSLQSSSTLILIISLLDAIGLEYYLDFGNKSPSPTSIVVRSLAELNAIPVDVEELWIGRFDTSDLADYSFNSFQLLRTLVIGNSVFWAVNLEVHNLISLESIVIGRNSFSYASSFSLTSWKRWTNRMPRSSSSSINRVSQWRIWRLSVRCVWKWKNGWSDDSDLPQLQSIQLDSKVFRGDDGDERKSICDVPYNYKNTLTMKSEIEWNDEWIDLPSLTSFNGNGENFEYFGTVILESPDSWCIRFRHPSVIVQWHSTWWRLLPLHYFTSVVKYGCFQYLMNRFTGSRICHPCR